MQPISNFQKQLGRLPLYMRVAWAAIVVFGMVGNCSGHREQSLSLLFLISIMWISLRILTEGVEAWHILHLALAHERNDQDNKKDPPGPPAAT